jgi:hypothetical protein
MESRALSIAFFYAVGTAAGGIVGPLLFRRTDQHRQPRNVAWGFLIGAGRWGPGRFSEAVAEAVRRGRIRRLPRGQYASVHHDQT